MAKYSIEINGPRCESVIFNPTGMRVRGRWEFAKNAHRDKAEVLKTLAFDVPVIPGKIIALDVDDKKGRIIDPLSSGEGAAILKKVNEVFKDHGTVMEQGLAHPSEDHVLTTDSVKDWLYWMRRLVDAGLAVVTSQSPELPPLDEIRAMPGRRLADPLNSNQQSLKAPDDQAQYGLYKWADEVKPRRGQQEPAGAAS